MAQACFKEIRDRGSEISKGNVYKRKEKIRKTEREMVGCDRE